MALDEFRRIELSLDSANDAPPLVTLSEGDSGGRTLRVEVWQGGAAVPPAGLTARLLYNYRPRDPDSAGDFVDMPAVSGAKTATFEAAVPPLRRGDATLAVELSSGGSRVLTRTIRARVEPSPLNAAAASAQDAVDRLYEAFDKVGGIDAATKAANDAAKKANDAAAAASAPATASKAGLVKPGAFLSVGSDGALTLAAGFLPVFLKDAAGKSPGRACLVVDLTSSPVSFYYDDGK